MIWHVLDVRAVWVKEFASALGGQVPTLGWCPRITIDGMFRNLEEEIILADPHLRVRYFPLQRGFAKFPMSFVASEAKRLIRRLAEQSPCPADSPLICCSPHYAQVAEDWLGPVIYYATDLFTAWGQDSRRITSFERRMCKAADLVFPDSEMIAEHLVSECGCPGEKIQISPMATRSANLLDQRAATPFDLPGDVACQLRPIAGVIGNLAANMDWLFLDEVIGRTPWLSWLFVGPTTMPVPDPEQEQARRRLIQEGGRVCFVGEKRYGELRDYARAIDVAILPYRKVEPTHSGSSTRFYEHLAAVRPILATRAVAELLDKEPLLKCVATADQMIAELDRLRESGFRDGLEEVRRHASMTETWDARVSEMRRALDERVSFTYKPILEPGENLSPQTSLSAARVSQVLRR